MTSIGTNRERHLTRGVFPIAPVKPFTDCDMKVLEVTDFNAAVLERIMAVEKKAPDSELSKGGYFAVQTSLCNYRTAHPTTSIPAAVHGTVSEHGDLEEYLHKRLGGRYWGARGEAWTCTYV